MRKQFITILATGLTLPAALALVSCRSEGKSQDTSASELPMASVAEVKRGNIICNRSGGAVVPEPSSLLLAGSGPVSLRA